MSKNLASEAKRKSALIYAFGAAVFIGGFSLLAMLAWLVNHLNVSA